MASLLNMIRTQIGRQFVLRRHRREIKLVADRTRDIKKSDILLVSCLRNEMTRMPFFCDYYRKLGVNQFLFIDNNSDDGFQDWARQQPDVSVWFTKASYKASKFGMEWCNHLLKKYGTDHLCLSVDPDEFLVYPHMETRSLRDLGEYLKNEKKEAFHVVMLDAYSEKTLNETVYQSGDDPFKVAPFFDRDGYIQISTPKLPTFTRGGPRMRIHNRLEPLKSPALNKIPLVWWKWNYRYTSSMHDLRPMRLMRAQDAYNPTISGALFHFKFFASLTSKAEEEMVRKEHFEGGTEYHRYMEAANPHFYEEGISIRYESPDQLIRLGLISPGSWI